MTQDRIAQKDLDWWLDLAAGVEWTFARNVRRVGAAQLCRAWSHGRNDPCGLQPGGPRHPHIRTAGQVLRHDEHLPDEPRRCREVVDDGCRRVRDRPRRRDRGDRPRRPNRQTQGGLHQAPGGGRRIVRPDHGDG